MFDCWLFVNCSLVSIIMYCEAESSTAVWVAPSGCCARGPRAGVKLLWSCWEAESSTALWVAPSGCCARGPRAGVKLLWSYCEAECSTALWVAPSGGCARGPRTPPERSSEEGAGGVSWGRSLVRAKNGTRINVCQQENGLISTALKKPKIECRRPGIPPESFRRHPPG